MARRGTLRALACRGFTASDATRPTRAVCYRHFPRKCVRVPSENSIKTWAIFENRMNASRYSFEMGRRRRPRRCVSILSFGSRFRVRRNLVLCFAVSRGQRKWGGAPFTLPQSNGKAQDRKSEFTPPLVHSQLMPADKHLFPNVATVLGSRTRSRSSSRVFSQKRGDFAYYPPMAFSTFFHRSSSPARAARDPPSSAGPVRHTT